MQPGVTGDYAHPTVQFAALATTDTDTTITTVCTPLPSHHDQRQGEYEFTFDDWSNNATHPQANTALSLSFLVQVLRCHAAHLNQVLRTATLWRAGPRRWRHCC